MSKVEFDNPKLSGSFREPEVSKAALSAFFADTKGARAMKNSLQNIRDTGYDEEIIISELYNSFIAALKISTPIDICKKCDKKVLREQVDE